MTLQDYRTMGYCGYWDGYDRDAIKGTVDRRCHNEYVKGWIMGEEEAKELHG